MPRSFSTSFKSSLLAPESGDMELEFIDIDHPSQIEPVRVVNDVVDYLFGGNRYFGWPFMLEILTDGDAPPKGRLTIQNTDRRIGNAIRNIRTAPSFTIRGLALSDFGAVETIDGRRTRQPLGTPTVEYFAPHLALREIDGDAVQIAGDVVSWRPAGEPWPAKRATRERCPALFR